MCVCKICHHELKTVISFGKMPISNRFLTGLGPEEYVYDLSLGWCPECLMVQLESCVDPAMMFNDAYAYFSGLAVSELARRHGLQLVNMVPKEVHGGSMRYYLRRGIDHPVAEDVAFHLSQERALNLHVWRGYVSFKETVDRICSDLKQTLVKIKGKGKRIAACGATSKSTTLLIYSQIGPDLIDYVSDTTPTKIGKYTPGTYIPVRSHAHFIQDNPPYTLLLAWNHKREILEKEKGYREKGGKFITFFPEIAIV